MLTIGTFFKDRRGSAPQFTAAHTGPKDRRCSPHTNHANTQNMANMVTNIRCFRSSPAKGGQVTGLPRVDVPYESFFPAFAVLAAGGRARCEAPDAPAVGGAQRPRRDRGAPAGGRGGHAAPGRHAGLTGAALRGECGGGDGAVSKRRRGGSKS